MVSPDLDAARTTITQFAPPRTATVRLTYRTQGRVVLRSPAAAVWRGQLGHFLRRIAPEHHHEQHLSLYQRLFRTPRAAVDLPDDLSGRTLGRLGLGGEHVPHPFVVRMRSSGAPDAPCVLSPGADATIEVTLVEGAIEALPTLCAAFEELARTGIGSKTEQPSGRRRRGRARLAHAMLEAGGTTRLLFDGHRWTLPPACTTALLAPADGAEATYDLPTAPAEGPLWLALRTPLRLKHRGRLVRPGGLSVSALGAAYFRRLVGLAVCYGAAPPAAAEVGALHGAFLALGAATTLGPADVRWVDDARYSGRQQQRHPTGGLVGTVALTGSPAARRLWRRLARQAAPLHLGKKTAMGLGHVEPVPAA